MENEVSNSLKVKIMRSVEIPLLTRCCFCVPLRRGLITIAYINLIVCLPLSFLYYAHMFMLYNIDYDSINNENNTYFRFAFANFILELVLQSAEFILTIILIIGLHMKRVALMKWYLNAGIGFLLMDVVSVLISLMYYFSSGTIIMFFAQIMIQTYTLILLWSSVVKITRDGSVKYTRSEDQS